MRLLLKNQTSSSYMLFPQGAKIEVTDLHYAVGGGAANTAVGMRRLGHQLKAYFCIGDDKAGETIQKHLQAEGVSLDHLEIIEKGVTATSFIIPSIEGNHVVFVYKGVNKQLSAKNFYAELIPTLDYLFFGPLSGSGRELLSCFAATAKKQGVTVVANPGMGQLAHEPEKFIEQLPCIDYLIVNAREAETMLKALSQSANKASVSHGLCRIPLSNARPCPTCKPSSGEQRMPCLILEYMREVIQRGPSALVVTNGTEGVYVATRSTMYFHPSLHVKPVSALGAGDAFSSGFIGALAHNKSLEEAIVYGVINASSVIQSLDAQEGLLTLEELEKRADKQGLGELKSCQLK